MLKKLHDKSKIWFAIAWIIAYCVLMSVGDALSVSIGIDKSVTLAIGFLLSAILLLFLKKNGADILSKSINMLLPQMRMSRDTLKKMDSKRTSTNKKATMFILIDRLIFQ
mgnify:CR=1 FL=1